jgi:hypothetical protein
MVPVLDPHQGQRVARELSDGALVVINGPGLPSVLIAAMVVTAVLAIPVVGVWLAMIALTMGASAFGEIIRSVSRGSGGDPDPGLLSTLVPRSIPQFVLCVLMAAGTVVPLWLLGAKTHQSPHFNWVGRVVAGSAWILVPVLMLALYGRTDPDGPLGLRRCVKLVAKHPWATLLALSLVPITLVVVEVALGSILYLTGTLSFYALDYMPMPLIPGKTEPPLIDDGIVYYQMLDYREYPASIFHRGYFAGLRHGYSFVGAIPASLSMKTDAGLNAEVALGLIGPAYLILRGLFSMAIVTSLLAAFAIQARWLGAIPSLKRRKPA